MHEKDFVLNEQTFPIIERIGKHMPGGFFIYRAEGAEELLYANDSVLEIFGCATLDEFKELTGNTFKGMMHPDDYEAAEALIVEQIAASDDDMDYVEYRIVRRDGQIRWVDDYGHYTTTKEYGGIYYVFISDITEKRQRMESDREVRLAVIEALSKSYHTMWLINDVETESFSLYRGDGQEGSIHAAPINEALSHLRYSQAKERYLATMVVPEDRSRLETELELSHLAHQLKGGQPYAVEYRRLFEDGERYFRIEFAKVDMPGGRMGIVCGFKDVDDEVRKEHAIQQVLRDAVDSANASNKAKSDFFSSMSHDIRTPMNGIIGMTAIASAHLDDRERVADCLNKISVASGHLLDLINEVLDMNKIESGKVELLDEDFDLSELVDSLLTMTRPQMEQRHHEFSVQISDVEHEKVIGDSTRVRQVFVNLLSNAIKYTPDGGRISLSIRELPSKTPGMGSYEFVFADNGVGMTEEFLAHLFDPFTRAEERQFSSVQGSGLGMTITRNLVQMMGGDIEVESTHGEGTTFTVSLVLKLQEAEVADDYSFTGLHVLVADDDPVSCESMCKILTDLGMNSEWVLSGSAAVERVRLRHEQGRDFDAIVVDWHMPGMDGVETTRRIRSLVGDDMPIVVISAYDWGEIEDEARHAGATAFASKPLFKTKLVHVFDSLVAGKGDLGGGQPLKGFEDLNYEGRCVLLVEDNPINAEIATSILEMTGLTVEWAQDGEVAVQKYCDAQPGHFDMVFMDIQMPRLNGYEAAKRIRSLDVPEARTIPIVALSANAFEDDRRRSLQAGMNAHVAKPLDFDELAQVLQRWMR